MKDMLADVAPLEGGVPVRHVWRVGRLFALMEQDLPFREAFLAWGEESLAIYDQAHALADVDLLEDERANAIEAWVATGEQVTDDNVGHATVQHAARRAVLAPLNARRLTMRAIANYLDVPLVEVVRATLSNACAPHAEALASVEEHLVEHGFDRPVKALGRLYGLPALRGGDRYGLGVLAAKHGLTPPSYTAPNRKYPTEEILRLHEKGKSWAEISKAVCRKHPHLKGTFTPAKAAQIGARLLAYRRKRGHAGQSKARIVA